MQVRLREVILILIVCAMCVPCHGATHGRTAASRSARFIVHTVKAQTVEDIAGRAWIEIAVQVEWHPETASTRGAAPALAREVTVAFEGVFDVARSVSGDGLWFCSGRATLVALAPQQRRTLRFYVAPEIAHAARLEGDLREWEVSIGGVPFHSPGIADETRRARFRAMVAQRARGDCGPLLVLPETPFAHHPQRLAEAPTIRPAP